ncbi:hypothetical protein LO762_21895 [Actinocorallia sp. API 0066]|uniref:TY-Chap domain-containing protein n=1 Tax=Actinocorallia sp. API 0066 TaxID=2896846 RepID=UPI001E2BE246|nr:hypothetical protein [Actinocorallia sp. API 0066]MCD0451827.1 hypothetical protein [Actinocorallia sp. API 0066]
MDWGEFTERLARELAGLDSHMVLVVHRRAEGSHYVQAFRTGDLLHAEAVSSSVLTAALRFDPVAEDRLADIGWRRPESFGNWSYDLSFSSPPDAYRELATIMTIALRDVQRADSPDELAYESFRGGTFLELSEFGVEPADPARATEKHVPPPFPDAAPPLTPVPSVREEFPEPPPFGDPGASVPGSGAYDVLSYPPPQGPSYEPTYEAPSPGPSYEPSYEPSYGPSFEDDPLTSQSLPVRPHPDDPLMTVTDTGRFPADDPLTTRPVPYPGEEGFPTGAYTLPRPSDLEEDPLTSGSFRFPPVTHDPPPAPPGYGQPPAPRPPAEDPLTSGSFTAPPVGGPERPVQEYGGFDYQQSWDSREDTAQFPSVSDDPAPGWWGGGQSDPPPSGPSSTDTVADVHRAAALEQEEAQRAQAAEGASDVPVAGAPAKPTRRTALRLAEAKANGDRDGYLEVLGSAELYVAGTVVYSDGVYVRAFTAPPEEPHRVTELRSLVADWPQPHWQLAVDDGKPSAGYLDALTLARLGGGGSTRLVMQKVLPHSLVVHYLEGGYDRVAGYVHRVADVLALTTPKQLYAALALAHGASTFSADDEAVHVLRWHSRVGGALRTPFGGTDEGSLARMPGGWVVEHPPFEGNGFAPGLGSPIPEFKVDSQRLPHGAEIYRFDRAGRRVLVAMFDADATRWAAV